MISQSSLQPTLIWFRISGLAAAGGDGGTGEIPLGALAWIVAGNPEVLLEGRVGREGRVWDEEKEN